MKIFGRWSVNRDARGWLLTGALIALLVTTLPAVAGPAAQPADWDIPNGHFFSQTGPGGGLGYTIVDDSDAKLWSEFRRLGGVPILGHPMSRRFTYGQYTSQVVQRGIMQWRPDLNQVELLNVMDLMHDLGLDDWLFQNRHTPRPLGPDFLPPNAPWETVYLTSIALLDDPDLNKAYFAVPDPPGPLFVYGLPTSKVTDMGSALVVRLQKGVMHKWKTAQPWAAAGQVTIANGGSLAVEVGMVDQSVLAPAPPPTGPPATAAQATATRPAGTAVSVPARPGAATSTPVGNLPVVNLTPPARNTATPTRPAGATTRPGSPTVGATVVGTVDPSVPVAGLAGSGVPSPPAATPTPETAAVATVPATGTIGVTTSPSAGASPTVVAASGATATNGVTATTAVTPAVVVPAPTAAGPRPGGVSGRAVDASPTAYYEPFGRVRYQSNSENAWVEGRIYDAAGRFVNGARVIVRGRDGWKEISRPTGGESAENPDGLYRVNLRSGADQLLDYAWTVQVIGPDDTPQSPEISFETDKDVRPDSRQIATVDFKANR